MDSPTPTLLLSPPREFNRRWYVWLVVVGVLLAALYALPAWTTPAHLLWLTWLTYLTLHILYTPHQVADHPAVREIMGLPVPALTILLLYGVLPALAMLMAGALLAGILVLLMQPGRLARLDRPYLALLTGKVLVEIGALGAGLLAGAGLYTLLGGLTPLQDLALANLPSLLVLFGTHFLVSNVLYLWLRQQALETAQSLADLPRRLGHLLLIDLTLLLPVVILVINFNRPEASHRLTYTLVLMVLMLAAPLIRNMGLAQHRLEQRMTELLMLGKVGEALASTATVDALFQAIYEQVRQMVDAPTFYIAVPDSVQQQIDFPLMIHNEQRVQWPSFPWGSGPNEYILQNRAALLAGNGLEDLAAWHGITLAGLPQDCRSFLGVPIANQDEVIGVLAVLHPADPAAYTEADRRRLEIIAGQAAIAMGSARLLMQARQLADGVVLVNQVSNIINASLNLDTILRQICETALQFVGAPQAAIFLKGEEPQGFGPVFSIGLKPATREALDPALTLDDVPWENLLTTAKPKTIADLAADPTTAWLHPHLAGENIQALSIAPFISIRSLVNQRTLSPHRDLIGFMAIFYQARHSSHENELRLLEMLANQAAVAIENANLFEETQNAVKRLAYLAEATRIFTGSLALDQVSQAVVDWIVDALDLDSATLALWGQESDALSVLAHARGYNSPLDLPAPDLGYPLTEMPEVTQALQGRWSRAFRASEESLSPPLQRSFQETGLNTIVLTPLLVRDEVIGLLALGLIEDQVLPASDVNLAEAIASQAATAIQNAQFYNLTESALSDRVIEIASLEAVLRRISTSVDEDAIIEAVLGAAYTVTGAHLLSCALLTPMQTLDIRWRLGEETGPLRREEFPHVDKGIIGRVLQSGAPSLIGDIRQEPDYWPPTATAGYQAELCVPIQYEARPLGVLNLEHHELEAFNEHHLRFMQNLSGHAAIALARARLFASNRRQIEFLDAIRRLSLDLLGAPSMETALDLVCTAALGMVEAIDVHLYFYDEASDTLTFAASLWNDGQRNVERAPPRPDGLTRQGLKADQPLIRQHTRPLPGHFRPTLGVFPLKQSGQTIGVLNAAVDDSSRLGPDEVRALELLANQAAIAIERVRLFESRQRQIDTLDQLRHLSLDLLEMPQLDRVLQVVCASALSIVKAEDVHLYLYQEASDRLTFAASLWADGRRNVEAFTPRPDGLTARTARSGQPNILQGKELEPISIEGLEIGSIVGIPLKHSGQVSGVLNVAMNEADALDENQVRALELLANQAAIAIERVRLFESRQHQIDTLDQLRHLSLDLLEMPQLDRVLQVVCASALTIVNAEDVHLYLYQEASDRLTFAASLDAAGRRNGEAFTPRPDGLIACTARSGQPNVLKDDRVEPVKLEGRPGSITSGIIGIPLQHSGQVIGVLSLAVPESGALDVNQLGVLELLANQSAGAIRNVRLYEQVRGGRDRLQTILNTVQDGLVLVDTRGYLLQINPAAEEFLGIDMQPYVGQHILRVLTAVEAQTQRIRDFFSQDSLKQLWRDLRRDPHRVLRRQLQTESDGKVYYVNEESVPVLSEEGTLVGRVFIWRDVTEAHMLEETRTELTNTIVHDLRSPLTAIKGGLSVLQELTDEPADLAMAREIVQVAQNSTDSLLVLVESLLDVARMETEDLPLDLTTDGLQTPAAQAMKLLEVLAREANIALSADLPDDLPPVLIDVDKMRRVLVNLLDNALRYTPAGGSVSIKAAPHPEAGLLTVSVEDTGPGIPPEVRESIFDKWQTGLTGQHQKRGRKGLGLGLTFCRLAVEAHGGTIWVEEGAAGGAVFRFTLPISTETSIVQKNTPPDEPG